MGMWCVWEYGYLLLRPFTYYSPLMNEGTACALTCFAKLWEKFAAGDNAADATKLEKL